MGLAKIKTNRSNKKLFVKVKKKKNQTERELLVKTKRNSVQNKKNRLLKKTLSQELKVVKRIKNY